MKKCNVPKLAATKHGSNMWLAKQGVQIIKKIRKYINFKKSKILCEQNKWEGEEGKPKYTNQK